jgi:hypothetical protein
MWIIAKRESSLRTLNKYFVSIKYRYRYTCVNHIWNGNLRVSIIIKIYWGQPSGFGILLPYIIFKRKKNDIFHVLFGGNALMDLVLKITSTIRQSFYVECICHCSCA